MKISLMIVSLIVLVPITGAQTLVSESGDGHHEYEADTFAVAGLSVAGNMHVWIDYPAIVLTNTDTFDLAGHIEGPDTVALAVATYAWSLEDLVGCTSGGLSPSTFNVISNNAQVKTVMTMTANFCRGILRVDPSINAMNVQRFRMPFYVRVVPTAFTNTVTGSMDNLVRLCNASALGAACAQPTVSVAQSGTWQVDNLNRLCNFSAFGSTCTKPALDVAVTGTVTVVNSGGQAITVSGTLDELVRLCNFSALGGACTQPTISVAQSGAWQIDNLNRLCNFSSFGSVCTKPVIDTGFTGNVSFEGNLTLMRIIATLCGGPITANQTLCEPVKISSSDPNLFDVLEAWFPVWFGLILILLGEIRSDFIVRGFGAFSLITGYLVSPIPNEYLRIVLVAVSLYYLLLFFFSILNGKLPEEKRFRRN